MKCVCHVCSHLGPYGPHGPHWPRLTPESSVPFLPLQKTSSWCLMFLWTSFSTITFESELSEIHLKVHLKLLSYPLPCGTFTRGPVRSPQPRGPHVPLLNTSRGEKHIKHMEKRKRSSFVWDVTFCPGAPSSPV